MTWILLNKRITAIIILCLVVLGQLAYTNHLAGKLRKANDKCESEKQAIIAKYEAERAKAQAELNQVSELYEAERAKEKVINNERIERVREIIKTDPNHVNCAISSGLLSEIRQATITE